jgi:Zn-dependent peptidase ImmA (M78 family)
MEETYLTFEINNDIWLIEMKSADELNKTYKTQYPDEEVFYVFGLTEKSEHNIYINNEMCKEQQIKTLKHELTHCYIWEYGLYNVPHFSEEMVCDLVSSINDFIDKVVADFKIWQSAK